MGTNFGSGDTGSAEARPRTPLEGKVVAVCVVLIIAVIIWAAVTNVQAENAHAQTMQQLTTEYEQLAGDLAQTQSIAAPETGNVSEAYERAIEQAAPVTAFQQTGENVDAARAVFSDARLLTGEMWYPGALTDATWEFSLAYRIADGGYPCGWFGYGADGRLLAYALSSFNGEQFTSCDVYLTAAGRELSAEATVDPVDIMNDAPTTTDPDPVDIIDDAPDQEKSEQQQKLEEMDSMQSGVTANPPDDEE